MLTPQMCVRLRSGKATDPRMQVVSVVGDTVECRWFDDHGAVQSATFPAESLYEAALHTMTINGKRNIYEQLPNGDYTLIWKDAETPVVLVAGAPNNGWPVDGTYLQLPNADPLADVGLMKSIFSRPVGIIISL